MDIPASALSHPFELYPVHIPGWVTFLQPPNIAHGGIPKSIYDDRLQGLQCVINPLTDLKSGPWIMAAFDHVDLYVNGIRSTGAGHTVQPGDEAKFIVLYLPHGELRDGVNALHYRVTRLSGNFDDSISLDVLYHLRAPGEPAPQNMDLVIPPDVISDGVSADRAAQGVKFGFTYGNRRDFDRIEFRIGAVAKPYDVPSAPAPAEYTLFTDTFRDVGDGAFTAVQFKVTDQLGNSNLSSDKYIDVHLDRQLTLAPPSVKEASGASLNPVNAKDTLTIVVPVNAELLPTDKLTVTWTGAPGTPAGGSHTSGESLVSAGLEIPIPNSVVAFNLGRSVTVSYAVIRGSEAPVASPPFALAIQPLAPGDLELGKPRILEAANNGEGSELNLASIIANVTCWFGTWPLIAVDQDVWLRFKGTKADNTTPYNLDIWVPKPPTKGPRVNQGWVNNGFYQPGPLGNSYNYLKDLKDGSTLTVEFKADFSKTIDEANAITFPQRTYTVKSIVVVTPTITSVKGQPSNGEIPDGTNTVETSVILSGTATAGMDVEIFEGPDSRGTFVATGGTWTTTAITVALGSRSFTAKTKYGAEPVSDARTFTVVAAQKPVISSVKGQPSNAEIPNETTTVETSVILSGTATAGMDVEIFEGQDSRGTFVATGGTWTTTAIAVALGGRSFTAKAKYGVEPVSDARTFTVRAAGPFCTFTIMYGGTTRVYQPNTTNNKLPIGIGTFPVNVDIQVHRAPDASTPNDATFGITGGGDLYYLSGMRSLTVGTHRRPLSALARQPGTYEIRAAPNGAWPRTYWGIVYA
ncbi:hypothetical protein [Pseudomonas sp. R1-6]|uniref:hypothetical protein n=1 Tax=Pseudomonas sp. R1-6 TaxID=2817397 RepID=UPI003DA8ED0F